MKKEEAKDIFIRYLVLVLIGFGLNLIYYTFRPLTIYPVYSILKLFGSSSLINNDTILFNGIFIQLIPACIAGSAYYLLLILNLTTPMNIRKRMKNITFLFWGFLILNIVRILAMIGIFFVNYAYFDITHKFLWYIGSTIIVAGIWFTGVFIFKIKDIPVYGDIKKILKDAKKQ